MAVIALHRAWSIPPAFAEGTDELGPLSKLTAATDLYVDILDPVVEKISWTGSGSLSIIDPSLRTVGILLTGQTANLAGHGAGAYRVVLVADQIDTWAINVVNQTQPGGRLHSLEWQFNTGTFAGGLLAQDTSYYVLMPGGASGHDTISEMRVLGLQGDQYTVSANATGVDGPNAGRSVAQAGNSMTAVYPIYLNPPTIGHYNPVTPVPSGVRFAGGPMGVCTAVQPGSASPGSFEFTSNVSGTYQIVCDLDHDNVFDRTSNADLLLVGSTVSGTNHVPWNGTDKSGRPISPGTYQCQLSVNVGELHFIGADLETAYPGLRMFNVEATAANASRTPLAMFWNDELVLVPADVLMPPPLNVPGLVRPGPNGMNSGTYTSVCSPNVNARAWGNFNPFGNSKGNLNFLDTFSVSLSTTATPITIDVLAPTTDSDGDGLSDYDEECIYGTDPHNPDTDGGGVPDGAEVARGTNPLQPADDQLCGDGYKTGTERCDDHNTTAGDGCSATCSVEAGWTCVGAPSVCTTRCGDDIKAGAEACDDGNLTPGDGCSATCTVETGWSCTGSPSACVTRCGDGIKAGTEACDDHNTTAGDGCSATCTIEAGWTCTGSPSTCMTRCGDGIKAGTEACDDHNTISGDGCSRTCAIEPGWTCTGAPSTCVTHCGDGIVAGTEACDDHNTHPGDGCSATCTVEPGWTCDGSPSTCTTTCGDGIRAGTEACDDGNTIAADGCSPVCAIELGWTCIGTEPDICSTRCGDGVRAGSEACDDGNVVAGDGCSATCTVEDGWSCSGITPDVCEPGCGDGLVRGGEGCDDGNTIAGDGCSPTCQPEPGYTCTGEPSVCHGTCGDRVITPGEMCDDGNTTAGDGCSPTCTIEPGWTCLGMPSTCQPTCGDGVRTSNEQCDDGNVTDGDGCSSRCLVERGSACWGYHPDVCGVDTDGDGIPDSLDNCPTVANADQLDRDHNGIGDVCERYGMSGGGCSTSGDGTWLGAILVALVLVLRRRRALLALAVVLATPLAAHAQVAEQRDFPIERFELSSDRSGLLGIEGATVGEPGSWDLGLWTGDASNPLVIYQNVAGKRTRTGALIATRIGGGLVGTYTVRRWLSLGVELPLIFYQSRNPMIVGVTGTLASIDHPQPGDLRLSPKLALLRQADHGLDLAIIPELTLPTGGADYRGERTVSFVPQLAVGRTLGRVRVGANLGYLMRRQSSSMTLDIDDELLLQVGGGVRVAAPVELAVTVSSATAANSPFQRFGRNYLEVIGGPTIDFGSHWQGFAAGGAGLVDGYGTPDWRALLGVRIGTQHARKPAVSGIADRDHDGIPDALDKCPDQPEDFDGFQDADGCPDPDNDGDGIADAVDKCPNLPETVNGFQDSDGCPDTVPDRDGDGIVDTLDKCPDEPEDFDGFQDADGCPDPDNDGDGIVDAADQCPMVAGPVENHGCPDTDRDGDGIVDRLDNCPDEPGTAKNHGCKDKQLVVLANGKLELLDIVYFRIDKSDILPQSFNLLDNVARVLAAHAEITSIEVQGHTDSDGSDAYNLSLSQRRADSVRAYLVAKGIAADRLMAKGYGETQPIATNDTAQGRSGNRRVEFKFDGTSATVSNR